MRIKIPFNAWSLERIEKYNKCATSRTKKYGVVGDVFEVAGYTYKLTLVVQLPLWFIATWLYETEGAFKYSEFCDVWKEIHPRRGFVDSDMVWYHMFAQVD